MLTNVLLEFHEDIMNRDGKWAVHPDSGNPVDVVCGYPAAPEGIPECVVVQGCPCKKGTQGADIRDNNQGSKCPPPGWEKTPTSSTRRYYLTG